jgi:hypothetical protein
MTPRKRYAFWIDAHLLEAMELVRSRDRVLPSEQIRWALEEWLERRGALPRKSAKPAREKRTGKGQTR